VIEAAEVRDGDDARCAVAARDRPRHRDRPHLPARPQVRRGARPAGARPERQAGHGDDGVVRRSACRAPCRDRRGDPRRARPVLALARSHQPTSMW
jgi:hypothetical protein